ncbi:MAG: hypothetical protein J5642_04255 [Bacteroidales bacterium]|nr:hypothetical protein [Bacteroidales bacterium]
MAFIKSINGRVVFVTVIIIALLVACVGGMVKLAFFKKAKYTGDKEIYPYYTKEQFDTLPSKLTRNCVLEYYSTPSRGVIYDDQGRPLVSNVRVYPVGIDGRNFDLNHKYFAENSPYLDTLISDLAQKFYNHFSTRYSLKVEDYKKKFTTALKQKRRVQIFSEEDVQKREKMVMERDVDFIKSLPVLSKTVAEKDRGRYGLAGQEKIYFPNMLDLGSQKVSVRLHPYGDIGSRILGSVENKNGIDGCAMFNPILSGKAGMMRQLYVDGVSVPLQMEHPVVEGGHVYTTLNVEMQKIVHYALQDKAYQLHPDWACAVVMETATGDIKAITNLTLQKDSTYRETRNCAMVSEVAEPGSTFKLASLLAYLEQTNGDTTQTFPIGVVSFPVKKRTVIKKDSHPKNMQASIREIIKRSSNVGVAQMIIKNFPKYSDYVRKLDSMYITVGYSAQIGKLPPIADLRPETKIFEEQYSRYFGAAFDMQPMQTLVYYNAVANGGKMVQPRFVKSSRVEEKVTEYPVQVIREQIASPKTIAIAQEFLRAVVAEPGGTAYDRAKRVAPKLSFAGKTGTRDIYSQKLRGYDKDRNAVSFCGYFPAENPKYTCIVYLFNVAGGSGEAVEVFANIAKRILFPPKELPSNPKVVSFPTPVRAEDAARMCARYSVSMPAVTPGKLCATSMESGNLAICELPAREDKLPNVMGLNASDAVAVLRRAGYKVRLKGFGIVKNQSFDAQNKIITITLSPG